MSEQQMKQNWKNRTLYIGDNHNFMRSMNSDSVDLIATDPPFNTNRDFHATESKDGFSDRWRWSNEDHDHWFNLIKEDNLAVWKVIDTARHTDSDMIAAYLCFMGARILEMHRVLKPNGSIYIHCDPTASFYLRMILNAVFGYKNFRNEIVWKRSMGAKNNARRFHSEHDVILYYVKNMKEFIWNGEYKPLTKEYEDGWYCNQDENGRRYKVSDLTSPGSGGYKYEFLGTTRRWRYPEHRMNELIKEGRIIHESITPGSKRKVAGYKRYLDESKGALVGDLWTDIKLLQGAQKEEEILYQTQKPLALYQRIIKASSNPGDIVFDPFCGCLTTLMAAELENREWVGCDTWTGVGKAAQKRMDMIDKKDIPIRERQKVLTRTDDNKKAAPTVLVPIKVDKPATKKEQKAIKDKLLKDHGCMCQGCGREFDSEEFLEVDHRVPKSQGGSNQISNRVLLCSPCNRRKGNRMSLEELRKLNEKTGFSIWERV